MVNLVFVHGRNQQGRDPDQLRRRWAAGLNKGLTAAELPVLDEAAVAAIGFPFYGDVLYAAMVQGRAAVPDVTSLDAVGWVDPGLPAQVNLQQVAMLRDMATELGFDSTVVPEETLMPVRALDAALAAATEEERLAGVPGGPWFRALLQWVANNSGVDEAVIRGYLRDVSAYLELPGCREAVLNVVRPALLPAGPSDPDDPGNPSIVVGHSLGGVVCAELLAEEAIRRSVALYVAVGAPLGLDAVTSRMRPRGSARPVSPWVNVFDPRDWVALGSPLRTSGGLVEQLRVANPRGYEHSIEHYLAHPVVATVTARAMARRVPVNS